MLSFIDVTELKGPLRFILQFDGLCCAGKLAQLCRDANSPMKENLASVQFLRTLRDHEIDIDQPLLSVARHGFEALVSALLAVGADKNAADQNGYTPLDIAAEFGHEALVSALLAAGADKNAAQQDGFTPLHIAAEQGHEAAVSALRGYSS